MINRNVTKSLCVAAIVLKSGNCHSLEASEIAHTSSGYFGIQAVNRTITLHEKHGKPLFKQTAFFQPGLFVGNLLNKNLGYEFGYQRTFSKKHQRTLSAGQFFPGINRPLAAGEFKVYDIKQRLENIDFGILGYNSFFLDNKIFAGIGISYSKIRANMILVADQFPFALDEEEISANSFIFSQKKIIPFAKIGIQCKLNERMDFRLFLDWRNLARFKLAARHSEHVPLPELKYKNSLGAGVSLSYTY